MVRPTINSEKHIVQIPFNTSTVGVTRNNSIVIAKAAPSNNKHVREGALVKAVYVELWVNGSTSAQGTQITIFEKTVSGQIPAITAQMIALNDYPNKKNVLFTSQGLTSDAITNAVPILRQWIKIPKGKQRMGLGDEITLSIVSQVTDLAFCGIAIYKEYF